MLASFSGRGRDTSGTESFHSSEQAGTLAGTRSERESSGLSVLEGGLASAV